MYVCACARVSTCACMCTRACRGSWRKQSHWWRSISNNPATESLPLVLLSVKSLQAVEARSANDMLTPKPCGAQACRRQGSGRQWVAQGSAPQVWGQGWGLPRASGPRVGSHLRVSDPCSNSRHCPARCNKNVNYAAVYLRVQQERHLRHGIPAPCNKNVTYATGCMSWPYIPVGTASYLSLGAFWQLICSAVCWGHVFRIHSAVGADGCCRLEGSDRVGCFWVHGICGRMCAHGICVYACGRMGYYCSDGSKPQRLWLESVC
jgi:hypothetical protein